MEISECSFDSIMDTTARLAFDRSEIQVLIGTLKKRHQDGHDLLPGPGVTPILKEEFVGMMSTGLCILHSPDQLRMKFLYVKCNAGKGLFGGQKSVFNSYIQDLDEEDKWTVGAVFKVWGFAATSTGNLYRGMSL